MVFQIGNIKIKSDVEQAIIKSAGATSKRITVDRSKPITPPRSRKSYTPKKTQDKDEGLNFVDTAMLLTPIGAGIQGSKQLLNMMGGVPRGGEPQDKSPDQIPELNLGETGVDLGLTSFGALGLIGNIFRGLNNPDAMTPLQYGSTLTASLLGIPGVVASMLGNIKAEESGIQGAVPPDSNIFITLPDGNGTLPGIPSLPNLSGLGEWGNKILLVALLLGGAYIGGKLLK